ncbi:hypothetical protein [Leucobacter sp. wl10]|uniref:hypothetical protein n=1 Tax=Leucobacter sp. wl10 TaxID=2304677 RepID=UPI000E7EF7A3|nr:hypothetical protein [Leucobacter sp. wl10]RGE19064.1 hypothetical protein D1J51_13155 [Leucobacter sp. wl10]
MEIIDLIARVGAAICSKGDPTGARAITTFEDSNPHTKDLSAYDLGRLLSTLHGLRPENVDAVFRMMLVTADRAGGMGPEDERVRAARRAWIEYEMAAAERE